MKTQDILKDISSRAENLFKQMYALRNEKAELEKENIQLSQDLHAANNQLQRNQIDIANLNRSIDNYLNELAQLKVNLDKTTLNNSELSHQLKQKEEEISSLRKNIVDLKIANTELENKNAALYNENESAKLVIKDCESEIQRLNQLFQIKKKVVTKKKL